MPSSFNVPMPANLPEIDRRRFSRLPVWMAKQEVAQYPMWNTYTDMFESMNWKPNSGDVVVAVTPNQSPIGSQTHRPNRFLEQPLVDTHETTERNEQGTIRRHRYKTPPMRWDGDFADFVTNQLTWAMKDLTRQIGVRDAFFIRDQLLAQAENVYVVGRGFLDNVPTGEATTTSPKTADFWANAITQIGADSAGVLDFKTIAHIRDRVNDDLNIPPWEGGSTSSPGDNELMKGKYILIGAGETYSRLTYDASVTAHRPLAMDLLHSRFKGAISDNIIYRTERFPLRFNADGTLPPLEIEQERPAVTFGARNNLRPVPHPLYRNSGITATILLGGSPIKTLRVGPPPSEFTSSTVNMGNFNKLNWNGEVVATKNIIQQYADGTLENNVWGDQIQLIAQTSHGVLPVDPRNIVVILSRRDRNAALSFS